ncbi:hypothetical protein ASE63_25260 [Bosea sp. Root381]|uniref:helix-turn-helix domain-containing protein n=1 Tax=Bosea sp. Root381 TaxID=1736524 RepID=UPI0007128C8F|nr:helix-turn-helix domain-containing protein [Bosea sp. Root381]KRE04923.1 hypothetical protein ASE63_25260 [Bosea sp. Root381]
MLPVQFDTRDLPRRKQIEAWRAWYHGMFDIQLCDDDVGCSCSTAVWSLPDFGISTVATPALTMMRDTALLRSNPIDHWVIMTGQRRTVGAVAETALDVPAQVPFVASLGQKLMLTRPADERTHLFLPRDGFRELASLLDATVAQPLDSALGRLLGDFIFLLRQSLSGLDVAEASRLTGAVRSMVLACIAPTADRLEEASPQVNLTRREQVRQFIDRNLRNPGLDTHILCRELGMSRTQLYRLFEQDRGVAHYIRHRRLLSCYGLLSDPLNTFPINVIADQHCFEDASSFSRAFKQEFGCNPRDVRAATVSGQKIAQKRAEFASEYRTLDEYLKGL